MAGAVREDGGALLVGGAGAGGQERCACGEAEDGSEAGDQGHPRSFRRTSNGVERRLVTTERMAAAVSIPARRRSAGSLGRVSRSRLIALVLAAFAVVAFAGMGMRGTSSASDRAGSDA